MALPTKEGHLYKYKKFTKKWLYGYFKANRTYLQYYETQHSLHPKENIVRADITSVESCSLFSERVYAFTICSKSSKKLHVSAKDESEMHDWMEVLRAHLPPSLASASVGTKSSKEKLLTKDPDPCPCSSPTEVVPPLPGYMAAQLPPSYEDVYPPTTQSEPSRSNYSSETKTTK